MNNKIKFGIVGSGWRAGCYLEIARSLPETFKVCGVVSRDEIKREYIAKKWKVNTYKNVNDLIDSNDVNFLVMAVSKDSAHTVIKEIVTKEIPLLAETPPANTLNDLIEINSFVDKKAKIQIAEQYFLYPMHSARLSLVNSNLLGNISFSHISISHGYHGISLMRKTLGIGFENAEITAAFFNFPCIEGAGRNGLPDTEKIVSNEHVLAVLDFNGKAGLYDFEKNQHRSWARSCRILVRGERGEINDSRVKYLIDYKTPVEYSLERVNTGMDENLEGYYLKGITAGGKWVYTNPFVPARLSDDEIAISTALKKMDEYIKKGVSFYSLAEASQDQYLAFMIEESFKNKKHIITETQCWGK